MTLIEFIAWLLGSGGVGYVCSRLLEWCDTYWVWFKDLRADLKRLATFTMIAGTATLIGTLAIVLESYMNYAAIPETPQAWIERLFVIAATAIVSSQVTHASRVETARREALTRAEQAEWDEYGDEC